MTTMKRKRVHNNNSSSCCWYVFVVVLSSLYTLSSLSCFRALMNECVLLKHTHLCGLGCRRNALFLKSQTRPKTKTKKKRKERKNWRKGVHVLFKTKTIFMKLEVLLASHKRGALSSIHYVLHQRVNKVVPRRVRWAPESLSPSRGARHRCVFFFSQVVFEIIFWSIPTHACEREISSIFREIENTFFFLKNLIGCHLERRSFSLFLGDFYFTFNCSTNPYGKSSIHK